MKKLLSILLPATIIVVIIATFFRSSFTPVQPQTTSKNQSETAEAKEVQVSLDFGDDTVVSEPINYQEGQTAFSVLERFAQNQEFDLQTKQYDFGVFVQSISGHESSSDMAWIYYVNGESGQVAADQNKLSPGDLVEWKYVKPE